jgi:hypothetical protein
MNYWFTIKVPLHGVCTYGKAALNVVSFISTPVEYCKVLIKRLVTGVVEVLGL